MKRLTVVLTLALTACAHHAAVIVQPVAPRPVEAPRVAPAPILRIPLLSRLPDILPKTRQPGRCAAPDSPRLPDNTTAPDLKTAIDRLTSRDHLHADYERRLIAALKACARKGDQ